MPHALCRKHGNDRMTQRQRSAVTAKPNDLVASSRFLMGGRSWLRPHRARILYPNFANLCRRKTRQGAPDVASRRLGQVGAYLTVRDILPGASKGADGVLWREFCGFSRFRFATLGFTQQVARSLQPAWSMPQGAWSQIGIDELAPRSMPRAYPTLQILPQRPFLIL